MSDAFGPELPVTAAELWKAEAASPTLPTRPTAGADDPLTDEATAADTPRHSRTDRGDPA